MIWLLSSLTVSGSALGGLLLFRSIKHKKECDATAHIQVMIQSAPGYCPFPTQFFAEILQLSTDKPTHLEQFSLAAAHNTLQSTGLMKAVEVKKIKPNILFIDYIPREPYIMLGDYSNTAMDLFGFFFPFYPLHSPRKLPILILGQDIPSPVWGEQLDLKYQKLIQLLYSSDIKTIDLSHIEAPSAGRREVVLTLNNGTILRMHPKDLEKQLTHYQILSQTQKNTSYIIDLRIPDVALLQPIPE